MKKVLLSLLVLVLVVGGAAWYFVNFRLDSMIRNQIETAGSVSLGTRVTVGKVTTSIKDGSLTISDVSVANPPGFKNRNAFSLNNIEAAVDYANLDIKRLVIEDPEIVIEELGGKTNFSDMMQALESGGAGTEAAAGQSEEPVIVVRHFRMSKSRAAFESASLDRYTDIEIDAVELSNLKGTPTEVAKVIAAEILSEVASEAATELLKAQAGKMFEEAESKVSEKLKGLLGGDDKD